MPDIRIVPANAIMSFTSSLNFIERITQDPSGSLNLYGSGSTGRTEILSIDGNNGRLFTVSDDLSDSLFSVNTIAGLPVIEAFADNSVNIGQYSAPPIRVIGANAIITGSLSGTATQATNAVNIAFNLTSNNANYPIAFSLDNNAGNKPVYLDTNLGCYVNPATDTIGATNIAASTRMDAPIYYDSNNTAYYVNPDSTSRIQTLLANTSITAPIYYDAANSGYYINADSTSILSALQVNGVINASSNIVGGAFIDYTNSAYYFDGNNTGDSIRVAGDIVAYYSDERLKDRKGNIENALEKLVSLNGFYYEPNERAQELGYKKKLEVGVSAQEVEAILPEIVKDAPIGQGYKTLDYSKLVPLLIEAIKEQQKQIEELKSKI